MENNTNNATKTKNAWIIVASIVIVLVLIFIYVINKQNTSLNTAPENTNNQLYQPNSANLEPESTFESSGKKGEVPISYANALVKYADKRIQFNKNCQAIPNNVTYKDNTGLMIDNRSPQSRTIKIGTTYTIKPYGFKIIILPDVVFKSKTILVDCDKMQNVATILVQE